MDHFSSFFQPIPWVSLTITNAFQSSTVVSGIILPSFHSLLGRRLDPRQKPDICRDWSSNVRRIFFWDEIRMKLRNTVIPGDEFHFYHDITSGSRFLNNLDDSWIRFGLFSWLPCELMCWDVPRRKFGINGELGSMGDFTNL